MSDCRNETEHPPPVKVAAERPDSSARIAQLVTIVKERVVHFSLAERSSPDKALAAHEGLTLICWRQDDRIELPNAGGLV